MDDVTALTVAPLLLVAASCVFGFLISQNPPNAKYNPLAVAAGIVMTLFFATPSQYIAIKMELSLLSLIIPWLYFATSLGVVGVMWVLKHNLEEVVSEAYRKLYKKLED